MKFIMHLWLCTLCFVLASPLGGVRAEASADHLIALSEPVVADSLDLKADPQFSGVYVVTDPSFRPHRYSTDLPRAGAAVCGRVAVVESPPGQAKPRRFYAVFAGKPGQVDDTQVDVSVEDNDPKDLSQGAMERSASFMRGWRQYCVDASHPG